MAISEISKKYQEVHGKYDKLGQNLVQALNLFLEESKIGYLSINHRVKDKGSFLEKIERKKYKNPFSEIEDICGIRIICYYQSDVAKICEIIQKEFEIIDNQDKENLLNSDQFGYKSTHFIVKIKSKWLQAPNYRGLEDLTAEIQVRTILMHAWAEIEHKLSYKSETQVPKQFKRKLFIMSAKLEEADEQFEVLRNAITNYKEDVKEIAEENDDIKLEAIELNLDSLQAFLDFYFPTRKKHIRDTADLVSEFKKFDIDLNDIKKSYELVKDYLPKVEKEVFEGRVTVNNGWTQTGIAREIMDLTDENWREGREVPEEVKELDRKWSKLIFKENKDRRL